MFVSIRQAKRLLSQIVERCRNGNETSQDVLIPASKVGLVIGKGGDTIKQLQVCYFPKNTPLHISYSLNVIWFVK